VVTFLGHPVYIHLFPGWQVANEIVKPKFP